MVPTSCLPLKSIRSLAPTAESGAVQWIQSEYRPAVRGSMSQLSMSSVLRIFVKNEQFGAVSLRVTEGPLHFPSWAVRRALGRVGCPIKNGRWAWAERKTSSRQRFTSEAIDAVRGASDGAKSVCWVGSLNRSNRAPSGSSKYWSCRIAIRPDHWLNRLRDILGAFRSTSCFAMLMPSRGWLGSGSTGILASSQRVGDRSTAPES